MIIGGERRATPDGGRVEALDTIKRGMSLSPEIRRGMLVTIALAVVATSGRVIIPVAIQQVLDGGLAEASVDMGFVGRMVVVSLAAVAITAVATGLMHLRLAVVSELALSNLRVRAFRHIHDLSMLHQASEQRGVLVARVTSDIDQISRFLQWAGLMILINGGPGDPVHGRDGGLLVADVPHRPGPPAAHPLSRCAGSRSVWWSPSWWCGRRWDACWALWRRLCPVRR